MNYNSVCDIKVGNEIVPLSLEFVNGTKIKSFTGDMLIDLIIKNYRDNKFYIMSSETIISDITVSLNILNDIYCNKSDINNINKNRYESRQISNDLITLVYFLNNLQYYYIVTLLTDLLCVDKRILHDDEDWIKFVFKLNDSIFRHNSNIVRHTTVFIRTITCSIKQQYLSPMLPKKDLLILLRKQHSHKFTSSLKFMRIC